MLEALIGEISAISVKYRFILSNCFCVNMTIIPAEGIIVTSITFHSLTTGIIRIVKLIRNNYSTFVSKKNIAYKKKLLQSRMLTHAKPPSPFRYNSHKDRDSGFLYHRIKSLIHPSQEDKIVYWLLFYLFTDFKRR